MNKTRKNKYLRKNRGNEDSKNKTRKVQRGGKRVEKGIREVTPLLRPAELNTAIEERKARAQPPTAAQPQPPAAAVEAPGITNEQVLHFQQQADENNKMKKKRFPMFKELIRKFKAWFIEKFTPGTADSMKKLEELTKIEERIESRENSQNVDENITNIITEFKRILTGILSERLSELQKISNTNPNNNELQERINGVNVILKEVTQIDNNNFTSESKTPFESSKKILEKPSLFESFKTTIRGKKPTSEEAQASEEERLKAVAKGKVEQHETLKKETDAGLKRYKNPTPTQGVNGAIMQMTNNKVGPEIEMQELPQNPGGNDGSQSSTVSRPPVPPRPKIFPSSESALSQQSVTRPDGPPNKSLPPLPSPRQPPPLPPPRQPQGGGNKTRKNGQYMREIKDNRTHLFNKEMQILNSIRNFKHGHIDNDNTKKQFMKAVKRG